MQDLIEANYALRWLEHEVSPLVIVTVHDTSKCLLACPQHQRIPRVELLSEATAETRA